MNLQDNDFAPKVKLDGTTISVSDPRNLELVKQRIAELKVAARVAEDEGDWAKSDELLDKVRDIRNQLKDAKWLTALSPEERAKELAWRERFAANCEACRQRGEQWYFDGPNMIIVVPEEELDEERCRAAWLAHRARPGPRISDDQLTKAAYVFARRFIKAKGPSATIHTAMAEIRHHAYPLMLQSEFNQIFAPAAASGVKQPYTLGQQLAKLIGFIRQEHRREFLDKLALWKPYPSFTSAKSSSSKANRPPLKWVTGKELRNMEVRDDEITGEDLP